MARPLKLGAAALVIIVGLAGMYLVLTPDRTGDPIVPPGARPEATARPVAGQTVAEAPQVRGEARRPTLDDPALSDRPRLPPAGDPAVWRERRVVAAADWRERTLALTEQFALDRGLAPEVHDELVAIQEQMFDAMAASRTDLEDGVVAAVKGREELTQARKEAEQAIEALLGEEDAAAFQAAMGAGVLR